MRSFEDSDVSHVEGSVDPIRDIDVVELELQLADLETLRRRLERAERTSRLQKDHATATIELLQRLEAHLDAGNPVRTMALDAEERASIRELWLLTAKPLMVVVNVSEREASATVPPAIATRASTAYGEAIAVSARIEAEVSDLDAEDQRAFLADLGLAEPGLHRMARTAFHLLELLTFFTAGEKEVRAWTLRSGGTALDAAATIHTDFAKGFIRAEVTGVQELLDAGSYAGVRDRGQQRLEGRDYRVRGRRRRAFPVQCLSCCSSWIRPQPERRTCSATSPCSTCAQQVSSPGRSVPTLSRRHVSAWAAGCSGKADDRWRRASGTASTWCAASSGGRAVLHQKEVTYAVVCRASDPDLAARSSKPARGYIGRSPPGCERHRGLRAG